MGIEVSVGSFDGRELPVAVDDLGAGLIQAHEIIPPFGDGDHIGRAVGLTPESHGQVPSSLRTPVTLLTEYAPASFGSKYPSALYTEIDQKPSTGTSPTRIS